MHNIETILRPTAVAADRRCRERSARFFATDTDKVDEMASTRKHGRGKRTHRRIGT